MEGLLGWAERQGTGSGIVGDWNPCRVGHPTEIEITVKAFNAQSIAPRKS